MHLCLFLVVPTVVTPLPHPTAFWLCGTYSPHHSCSLASGPPSVVQFSESLAPPGMTGVWGLVCSLAWPQNPGWGICLNEWAQLSFHRLAISLGPSRSLGSGRHDCPLKTWSLSAYCSSGLLWGGWQHSPAGWVDAGTVVPMTRIASPSSQSLNSGMVRLFPSAFVDLRRQLRTCLREDSAMLMLSF